ncbi:High cysteine membrane protein Group 1 [Giardia duodenalis]|uniref:High cysteine membrane protein Group 1 n=1 Tax=Giardia intestinalis (strain ATCC 50803 / WB clone C6) TaxID=184922 RepID=A8B5M8_GIAIC|nr:High cysteine membrane protein Group 1 [Giardia intestinalis]KAE8305144.1 High cysteine membrane protein Group 1 [Giardia intestinalis]|eukprot:XP_001709262.1 High cysteine membrane protein Group 1 [Giardia lamblia ATCC 50803]
MGVANCAQCQAPQSAGVVTCTECAAGSYKSPNTNECKVCDKACLTCSGEGATKCTLCASGKYLDGNNCVEASSCNGDKYPDPSTGKCTACNGAADQGGIPECTACTYDAKLQKPVCSACNGKKVKTELDGTTTCVDMSSGCQDDYHFKDGDTACLLCGDESKGVPNCATCTAAQQCTKCLPGFFKTSDTACDACGDNCATCSVAGDPNKCDTCMPGYFLVTTTDPQGKKCVACSDTTNGGHEGCSLCSNNNGFKCTDCKPNYKKQSNEDANDDYTCVKTCEDPTACGGTSGACDAMIIDDKGNAKHYCSYCGDSSQAPIDGICTSDSGKKGANTCDSHTCTQCTADYFLYMNGCYKVGQVPGSHMCKKADSSGICTEAASNKYFVVPEAQATDQSVLACGNPLGTLVDPQGTAKAYVGVEGCSQCKAPTAPSDGGMTPAVCTSCDNSKVPNKGGSGCVLCSDTNCKSCVVDNICEECKDGLYFKAGETPSCVSAEECKDGFFPTTDAQGKKVCAKCSDTANGGIADCAKCSLKAASARAGPIVTCSGCETKRLSPLNDACLEECPAGTYPDNRDSTGICASCHNTCASCSTNAETSCTACYPGYVLSRSSDDTGTCIKECTGDFMAHCKADGCSLNVGGSKYCDQCEEGYAPVDGVCTSIPATARDASGCKASGGKCTECGANYALLSGGCYNTQKLPGSSVCTAAQNKGQCQTCANGQSPAGGKCPACTEGCVKCAGSKETCTDCLAGYYKTTDNKCVKCTSNSGTDGNAITSVKGCLNCVPPIGSNTGSVLCYLMKDGNSTGRSTNKSSLSMRTIMEISVAMVAIGALVGFLCWWFIFRGRRIDASPSTMTLIPSKSI